MCAMLVRGSLIGCGVWLLACSPAPDFGGEPGTSTSTSSSSSNATSSTAAAGDGGGGGEAATGGGDPGGGGPDGGGGGTSSSTGGGGPACETPADCPAPAEPCQQASCDLDGVCGAEPRPAGTDGGACGVCQGGLHLGTCGYRLYTRPFPDAGAPWTAAPLSDVLGDSPDAPPPRGLSEVEVMQSVDRLFAWSDDGMLYEGGIEGWKAPVPIATRFPSFPVGASVALAVIWRPTAESADESALLTTDESPPRSISYTLSDGGTTIVATSMPTPIEPSADPEGPPQDVTPWSWGFVEQRGYLGSSNDWVVFWGAVDGQLYQYWGGNDDFVSETALTAPPVSMDGVGDAPLGADVAATWRTAGGVLHVLAP